MICTEEKTSVTTAMLFIQSLVERGRDFSVTANEEKLSSGEVRKIFRISYPFPDKDSGQPIKSPPPKRA